METLLPLYQRPPAGPRANFRLASDYTPAGDQPAAIAALLEGIERGERDQVLLGVTGSGKTFTAAHVIQQLQRLRPQRPPACQRP